MRRARSTIRQARRRHAQAPKGQDVAPIVFTCRDRYPLAMNRRSPLIALGLSLLGASACAGSPAPSSAPPPPAGPQATIPAQESAPPIENQEPPTAEASEPKSSDTSDPMLGLDGLPWDEDTNPLELTNMSGPFEKLHDYETQLASEVEEGCRPQESVSVPPRKLAGTGQVSEVILYRVPTGDSCTPEETCVIGLKTTAGWLATSRLCAGTVGNDRQVSVSDTSLSWSKVGTDSAVAVEYTVTTGTGKEKLQLRWQRFCSASSSQLAKCSQPFIRWCSLANGKRDVVDVKLGNGEVTLTSAADPSSACGGERGFVVGTFPLSFR